MVHLGVARVPADEPPPPPPPQMTTGELVTDMMHQFDELSEQIRDLGLKPEEETEGKKVEKTKGKTEVPSGRRERRSCLKRPGGGADGDERDTEGRTVQFGSTVEREGDGSGEGDGESQCKKKAGDVSGGQGDVQPTVEEETSKETDNRQPASTDRETAMETTDGGTEPQESPQVTPHSQETPEITAKSPSSREPTSTSQARPQQAPSPGRSPAPTCGFKRPVRAARRQQHPLKVVEARLLDWLSGRAPAAAAVPVADPLRVEIPAGSGGGGGGGGGGGVCSTDSVNSGDSDTAGSPAAIPADAAPAAPIISPGEAAARNRALLAYLQGQVRMPARSAPAPAPAQQLTEGGRPVPPEPLLESQDKQRRRIVNNHLSKA